MSKRPLLIVLSLLMLLLTISAATAQRPGGGRPTPSGGNRLTAIPTLARPGDLSLTPRATLALPNGNLALTPMPTLSLPEMGDVPRPTLVLPTLALPAASSQAEAAVLYFAATHLGVAPKLLYAGDLGSASGNAATVLTTVTGQLPAEMQAYITAMSNLSGAAYWGVWQIGSGVVAIGDCADNPNCTVTMDSLNLNITNSSAGVYGLYTPGQVTTSAEALALLLATFPALNGLPFEEFPTETGFAFQAITYDLGQNASMKYVYAGALSSGGQAFVYALVAVGDGYVELAR